MTSGYMKFLNPTVLGGGGSGAGDVVGPAGATASDFASFDGATGKLLKDSGYSPTDIVDLDTRLTDIEGADALSLTGITLTQSPAGTTGRMSGGAPNVFTTLVASAVYTNILNTLSFTLVIPAGNAANSGHLGTVVAVLNGVAQADTFDLAAHFNVAEKDAAQSYPPHSSAGGSITITSVQKYGYTASHQIWKGTINATSLVGVQSGENSIALRHIIPAGTQNSNTIIFFYDSDATRPLLGAATVVENTISSAKYISGVRKYSLTDTFDVGMAITRAFDNTFHNTPLVTQSATTMGISNFSVAYNAITMSGPVDINNPKVGEALNYAGVNTVNTANVLSEDARYMAYAVDPFGISNVPLSASENRMINTYGTVSTAVLEEFRDENRRLLSHSAPQGAGHGALMTYATVPAGVTGIWTSATALGNGEALQFNDGLVYPTQNFSTGYLPAAGQPNYSAFAGSQYYVRAIVAVNPHNSGTIRLGGWVLATIDATGTPTAKVEIKLPTQTGWLDLGKAYNAGTFTGIDNDGCRTSASGSDFGWSSGGFSTVGSGNLYIIRITLLNNTVPILTQIYETTASF